MTIQNKTATNTQTTTSGTYEVIPDMTITPGAGDYLAVFSAYVHGDTGGGNSEIVYVAIFVDGIIQQHTERTFLNEGSLDGSEYHIATNAKVSPTAGQVVDVRWKRDAGTFEIHERELTLFPKAGADISQAVGTVDAQRNNSTYALLDDMQIINPGAGDYLLVYSGTMDGGSNRTADYAVFVGGSILQHTERTIEQESSISNTDQPHMIACKVSPTAGQDVEIRWKTTQLMFTHERTLNLVKVASGDIFEAQGTADDPDSTTTEKLIDDMTITNPGADDYLAIFSSSYTMGSITVDTDNTWSIFVGGSKVTVTHRLHEMDASVDNAPVAVMTSGKISPTAGQDVEAFWQGGTTSTRTQFDRTLVILKEAAGGAALERTASQTITESDTVARIQGHIRAPSQTLTHSESILREGSIFTRAVAQSLTHSESIARIQGHIRTASQIITHSEVVTQLGVYARTASQSITHSSVTTRIQGHIRSVAQTLTHIDSVVRGGSTFNRTAAQTLTHSEVIARIQGHVRTISQNLTHIDSILREFGTFARTASQTLTHSEVIARIQGHIRIASQTITESDSVVTQKGFLRTASQTLTHSESIARIQTLIRSVTQTLTHSESVARIQGHIRTVTQSLTHSESIVTQKGFARQASQTITESDSVARIQGHIRTVSQNLTHSESIAQLGVYARTANQTLTHSEVITRIQAHIRTAVQTLTHSESILREFSTFIRTATTVLIHSSVVTRIQAHIRTVSQNITESDSVVAIKNDITFLRVASQTLTHSESILREFSTFIRTATQTLTHSEQISSVSSGVAVAKRRPEVSAIRPLQPLAPETIQERLTVILQIRLFKIELVSTRITNQFKLKLHQRESITTRLLSPEQWLVKEHISNKIKLVLRKKERFSTKLRIKLHLTPHSYSLVSARLKVEYQQKLNKKINEQLQLIKSLKEQTELTNELQEECDRVEKTVETLKTSLDKMSKDTMPIEDVMALLATFD